MTLNEHYYAITENGHAFYVGRFDDDDDALDAAIGIVYKNSIDSRVSVYTQSQLLRLANDINGLLDNAAFLT